MECKEYIIKKYYTCYNQLISYPFYPCKIVGKYPEFQCESKSCNCNVLNKSEFCQESDNCLLKTLKDNCFAIKKETFISIIELFGENCTGVTICIGSKVIYDFNYFENFELDIDDFLNNNLSLNYEIVVNILIWALFTEKYKFSPDIYNDLIILMGNSINLCSYNNKYNKSSYCKEFSKKYQKKENYIETELGQILFQAIRLYIDNEGKNYKSSLKDLLNLIIKININNNHENMMGFD